MKKIIWVYSITIVAVMFSQPVLADQDDSAKGPWERFSFNLGAFITLLNSDVRIGSEALGLGIDIDVEEALDLDTSTTVFRAGALYRFGRSRRHRLDLTYFDLRRRGTKVLERDIEFDDQKFTIGTTIDSFFNVRIFKGAYNYSFFQDDRFDVALSLGLYVTPIDIGISAAGIGTEEEHITAPLPVFGLRADFALTPKLFLKQKLEFFYLEIDNFKGSILDGSIGLEYNAWKHVGFGIAADVLSLRIEAEGEDYPTIDFRGNIEFNYVGLHLYTKIYF